MAEDIGSLLGNAGGERSRPTIEHNGKTYRFRAMDQQAKTAYERWLKDNARQQIVEDSKWMTTQQFGAACREFNDSLACRKYRFGGAIYTDSLQSLDGMAEMLAILAECTHDEAMELIVAKNVDVALIFVDLMAEARLVPLEQAERIKERLRSTPSVSAMWTGTKSTAD